MPMYTDEDGEIAQPGNREGIPGSIRTGIIELKKSWATFLPRLDIASLGVETDLRTASRAIAQCQFLNFLSLI